MPEFPYRPPKPRKDVDAGDLRAASFRYVSHAMSLVIRKEPMFVPASHYPINILVKPDELGYYNGTRIIVSP